MKKLKTISEFKKELAVSNERMEIVKGGKGGPAAPTLGIDVTTDDYSLGNVTGPYPLDGTYDCVDFRDGYPIGGLGSGQQPAP